MMRSEARTEDTSGFPTTTARSAQYIARYAPFSMPACEAQIVKSKPSAARSLRTFSTPSLLSASLSRVCEAASTNRVSKRLSLISACLSEASPWMTLTKSYTTRRSQPMIRSRLRRPTSKSMTATFLPRRARPHARLALVVVLPTPPLPDVTTMISAMWVPLVGLLVQRGDLELVAIQPHLRGPPAQVLRDLLEHLGVPGDGDELAEDPAAEEAGPGVALWAGEGPAAQRAVDVHRPVGDHLRARPDHAEHREVAVVRVDLLAGTHRLLDEPGLGRRLAGGLRRGFGHMVRGSGIRCLRRRLPGCLGRFVLGAELREQRETQGFGERRVLAAAIGQRDRDDAGFPQGVEQAARGGRVRQGGQVGEVHDHRG